MAKEPGFFSEEGFPYPLLALGQTFPRGYQYQSERTPYKRDARGDWGRALNEGIDQFFGMWPQYMQQKRQFALQRQQLARQTAADQHQAKLRPFELKQAQATQQLSENRMQMLKNYPTMVENLPVPDKYKAYLKTLPPTEGLKMMQAFMTQNLKPRTKVLQPGDPGNKFSVPINVDPGGKVTPIKIPVELQTLEVGDPNNPYKVKAQFNPQTKKVTPLNVTQELQTLPVGHENNPYTVPVQVHPLTKKVTPINVPQEVTTLAIGDPGNPYNVPVEFNPTTGEYSFPLEKPYAEFKSVPENDPRKNDYPKAFHKYLQFNTKTKEVSLPQSFTKELQERALALDAPSRSELFKTKHAPSQYANIQALGDLSEVAGNTLNGQRIAAVQLLPKDHKVARRALDTLNEAKVKMGKNGVFVPASVGKDYSGRGKGPISQSEPQSIPVNQGDSLDQIIQSFKAKGITVNPSQVIAANKHFFPEGDPNKMMTSAQVGNAEMLIPVGGGSLNETQVNAAHRSNDPRHNTTIIEGIGTYTNFNTATVPFAYKLNSDLADMKKLQSNVDQVVELMKDPNAISLMKTGHPARGLIEGLRWRLINNVQTLRDFGVLSPSEIDTIAKSVPDPNSFFNIVAGKAGLKPGRFIEGVLGALKKEGETKASQLRAFMNQYSVQEVDFKIHQYDPYEGQDNQNQNLNQQLDNELSSFE